MRRGSRMCLRFGPCAASSADTDVSIHAPRWLRSTARALPKRLAPSSVPSRSEHPHTEIRIIASDSGDAHHRLILRYPGSGKTALSPSTGEAQPANTLMLTFQHPFDHAHVFEPTVPATWRSMQALRSCIPWAALKAHAYNHDTPCPAQQHASSTLACSPVCASMHRHMVTYQQYRVVIRCGPYCEQKRQPNCPRQPCQSIW